MNPRIAALGLLVVGGSVAIAQTNDQLILDTTALVSANTTASYRDCRGFGYPAGGAVGIYISTNTPFVITRVDAIVNLQQIDSLTNTAIEFAVFRGTNRFKFGMLDEPDFCAAFTVEATNNLALTNISGNQWWLSFALPSPSYAWGTNRVLSIRTAPIFDGAFATMDLVLSSVTDQPGALAFVPMLTTDTDFVLLSTNLPAVRVWRQMLPQQSQIAYECFGDDLEMAFPPGFMMGCSTNMVTWDWQPEPGSLGTIIVNIGQGNALFRSKPDDTP